MAKNKRRFRKGKRVALANYEAKEEFLTVEERVEIAEETKGVVDDFYGKVFGGEPLGFLLVEETEEKDAGKFGWRLDEENNLVVGSVKVGYPSEDYLRLIREGEERGLGKKEQERRAGILVGDRYARLIIHEAAHLHNQMNLNLFYPKWLDEGLAEYLGQELISFDGLKQAGERRKERKKEARELVKSDDFKPLEYYHEYERWVEEGRDFRYYSLAYLIMYEMISLPKRKEKYEGGLSQLVEGGKERLRGLMEDYAKPVGVMTLKEYAEKELEIKIAENLTLREYRRLEQGDGFLQQYLEEEMEGFLGKERFIECFCDYFVGIYQKYEKEIRGKKVSWQPFR